MGAEACTLDRCGRGICLYPSDGGRAPRAPPKRPAVRASPFTWVLQANENLVPRIKSPLSRVLSPNPLTYPQWKAGAGGRRDCLILCQASPLSHTLVPTASHHRGLLPLPSCRTTKYDRPLVPDAEVVRMQALNQGLNGTGRSEDSSCPKREP